MKLKNIVEKLKAYGVGRRKLDDVIFILDKPPPRLGVYDFDDEDLCHELVITPCNVPGCTFVAESLLEYEFHYNSSHRYTCIECKKVLPSPHFLDLHIQESHDSFFAVMSAKKPSYLCYIEECKLKFQNAEERLEHCIEQHKLPKDFRFETKPKNKNRSKKGKGKKSAENKESLMEVDPGTSSMVDFPTTNVESDSTFVTTSIDITNTASTSTATTESKNIVLTTSKQKTFNKNKRYTGKKFTKNKVNKNSSVNIDEVMTDLKESLPE